MVLKIYRVRYGKKGTDRELREYQINGIGAVGTLEEYHKTFPDEELEIHDDIEGEPVKMSYGMASTRQKWRGKQSWDNYYKQWHKSSKRKRSMSRGNKQASWG